MNRAEYRFATSLLVTLAAVVLYLTYKMFFEPSWLTYQNVPFEPMLPAVKRGQAIPLHVVRCNATKRKQTYLIARSLEHVATGRSAVLDGALVPIKPGCTDETSLANRVPDDLPADFPKGPYRIIGRAQVQGDFRTTFVDWESKEFEVTE